MPIGFQITVTVLHNLVVSAEAARLKELQDKCIVLYIPLHATDLVHKSEIGTLSTIQT